MEVHAEIMEARAVEADTEWALDIEKIRWNY